MKKISAKEKEEFELFIKEKFNLTKLRPYYINNRIENEHGKLLLCKYYFDDSFDKERKLIGCDEFNKLIFLTKFQREEHFLDNFVNDYIIRCNNIMRSKEDVGYCLIEMLDANLLDKENMQFVILASYYRMFWAEKLYEEIITAMKKIINRDEFSITYWQLLAPSFPNKISIERLICLRTRKNYTHKKPTFDIWRSGYEVTGNKEGPALLAKEIEAETFLEAVQKWYNSIENAEKKYGPLRIDEEGIFIWGCLLGPSLQSVV